MLAGAFTSASDCPPAPHAAVGLMPHKKYSFILSHRRGANASCSSSSSIGFVGIGKTGSLFMQAALEFWAHEQLLPHRSPVPTNPCLVGARMGWHHASALLWRRAFGEAAWRAAFTFSLVRDPWARLVSHWAFHLTSKNPLDGGFLKDLCGGVEMSTSKKFGHQIRFETTFYSALISNGCTPTVQRPVTTGDPRCGKLLESRIVDGTL